MRKIDKIIVHCTATPEGRHTTVEDVRRWHLDRGWSDIGYHFLIYLDGSLHEGRPIKKTGAHCKGHNEGSIGIAYLKIQHADATIHGHNDFASKACPSFNATKEYDNITNMWK